MAYTLAQIAHIETDFSEKFGIPRQSGLVEELRARIVFEPEFRSPDAVRGLDGYDYIWLVWQFSTVVQAGQDGTNWRPTVRPPRLGGNTRMGVFATRSPFRPNALGLSSVKLLKVEPNTPQGPVLTVGGADLLDVRRFLTSSPTCPMWTLTRMPAAALPTPQSFIRCRYRRNRKCGNRSRRTSGMPYSACSAATPAPATSTTPNACTV